jgi:hypothetical protein
MIKLGLFALKLQISETNGLRFLAIFPRPKQSEGLTLHKQIPPANTRHYRILPTLGPRLKSRDATICAKGSKPWHDTARP